MYIQKNILNFNIKWTWKTISLLAFLAIFPNILGLYHTTIFGIRIHFFQYLIFLAAIIYGPLGGLISGTFGSLYTAIALNNPYIIIGNILLGTLFGIFIRLKWNIIIAVLTAYLIQLPWLWLTDIYLANMPINIVKGIVIALLLSNILWAAIAGITAKKIKNLIIT
jgi:uncharacterized membrane protein